MEGPSELVKQVTKICESVPSLIDTSLCYSEYCYQQLIRQLLTGAGLNCETEAPVYFKTKGQNPLNFGWGKIDVLVRGEKELVIIELKANVRPNIQQHMGQLSRYMEHRHEDATGILCYFHGWDSDVHHYILESRKSLPLSSVTLAPC